MLKLALSVFFGDKMMKAYTTVTVKNDGGKFQRMVNTAAACRIQCHKCGRKCEGQEHGEQNEKKIETTSFPSLSEIFLINQSC